jgi:hypothetical protein
VCPARLRPPSSRCTTTSPLGSEPPLLVGTWAIQRIPYLREGVTRHTWDGGSSLIRQSRVDDSPVVNVGLTNESRTDTARTD